MGLLGGGVIGSLPITGSSGLAMWQQVAIAHLSVVKVKSTLSSGLASVCVSFCSSLVLPVCLYSFFFNTIGSKLR
jgi:hypothetical protein